MPTFDEALEIAERLPQADRMRLIGALWGTISMENWSLPGETWLAECQRRSEDYDQGSMTAAPWAEVRERARRKAGLDG